MAYSYVWPPALPRAPRRDGWTEKAGANVLRTPMDAGPAKLRRRSARPDSHQCTYRMTTEQVALFRAFVDDTLKAVARFGWPHPRTKATVEARLVPSDDGIYTVAVAGRGLWDVTVTIEVMP